MIVTTDAVILRGMNFRDSSRILTLYTKEFGRLSVLAKGARMPKSKFGGAIEPLSYVTAVLYKKESRDLHLLSHCDIVRPFRSLTDDLGRMAAAMAVVELLHAVSHGEERNLPLFDLLVNSLESINGATKGAMNAFYVFEVRLLEILGFRPEFGRCAGCGCPTNEIQSEKLSVNLSEGGVFCPSCSARGRGLEMISQGAVNTLRRMQELSDISSATRIALTPLMQNEIRTTLRRYLQMHVEGLKMLKSEAVFASIL
jgi:DNA repair protein RecO (recombination protein O)